VAAKRLVLHEHRAEHLWIADIKAQMLSVLTWSEKGYLITSETIRGKGRGLPRLPKPSSA
jgi:hypothetical protein